MAPDASATFNPEDRASSTKVSAPARTPDKVYQNLRATNYPKEIWWTLACFIALVSIFQLGSFLHTKFARRKACTAATDPEKIAAPAGRAISLRRIPLAVVNAYRVIAFRCTVELGSSYTLNFAEVALTVMYMATIWIWAFIDTTTQEGQVTGILYWGDRAGTLAASQFPLITALGTKNNLVSLITGVSYDRLNYLHRMVARVVFVLLCVHAGARIEDGVGPDLDQLYLRAGIFAGVAFLILCLISIRPIRTGAYEIFFWVHMVMVIILLSGALIHIKIFAGQFDPYIFPSFIIWGIDRGIRFLRLVVFNHSYFGFKSGSGTLDGTTELLSDHLVRLTLHRPPHFHWKAGQTAYLIMPSVSGLPFESHPFTIASFDSSSICDHPNSANNAENRVLGNSAPYWKELVFLINVRAGFTKRLQEVAANNGTVKVFVDGPYGPSPDLGCYDTSVLIAGGSGVSYTLPVLLDIIQRVRNGTSGCRKVVFIWAIRDASHVSWISETLSKALQIAPPELEISVRIHCTGAGVASLKGNDSGELAGDDESVHSVHADNEIVAIEEKEKKESALLAMPAVTMVEGRPDLHNMLLEEVDSTAGRMCVSVCGSQAVARAVRHALRFPVSGPTNILKGGPSVTLHIESFGYA